VRDRIEVRLGDARATLPALPARSADAVFLDADKEGYVFYLQQALRILRPGGLLLADNVLAGGAVVDPRSTSPTARAIRAFLDAVAASRELAPVIVPLGDGCLLAVRS
jgi:predicted O-methyltransferase YrrM